MVPSYSKLSVATEQLDTALRLYLSNSDYFSVITLAGAAEEILGVFLKRHNQPNAFEEDLRSSLRVYRWLHGEECSSESMHKTINRVKNASKHMQGKKDLEVVCDAREEARSILDRAITNYYRLMAYEELFETPRIREFHEHLASSA